MSRVELRGVDLFELLLRASATVTAAAAAAAAASFDQGPPRWTTALAKEMRDRGVIAVSSAQLLKRRD